MTNYDLNYFDYMDWIEKEDSYSYEKARDEILEDEIGRENLSLVQNYSRDVQKSYFIKV